MRPTPSNPSRPRSPEPSARSTRRTRRRAAPRDLEVLEGRELLSTFTVTSLHGSGAGSFRQAIIDANDNAGPNTIDFAVSGTIKVGRTSLPAITNTVAIDGTSAPGFAGSPVVTVNFQGTRGLKFAGGSDGSSLESLALVKASNAGVTLSAPDITVQGNDIGLMANGKTAAGNAGDGIRINASSQGDIIGSSVPVSGVTYYDTDSISMQPVSGWQGICDSGTPGQYVLTGTSDANGLLYIGPISGVGGTSYSVNFPGAYSTSVYGPDVVSGSGSGAVLRLVGSYTATKGGNVQGFVFQGTTADLSNPADYQTVDYQENDGSSAAYVYMHSTMGDLAVGNAGDIPLQTDHAFLYSVSQAKILTDIVYPGANTTSTTAYGIWYNGGTSYTIAGGYSTFLSPGKTDSEAFLVDYDSATGQFSNWTPFAGPDGVAGSSLATHFEGISSPEPGVYTLAATEIEPGSTTVTQAAWATVQRNPDGTFGTASWVNLNYPGAAGLQTNDSVAGNQIVGIASVDGKIISYQGTVNTTFQLSNVIGGNGGNGIGIYGASNNVIAANNIGTDATGARKRGNAKNGILITQGASGNMIGGQASGGNDPTGGVFVRPPQGNLISANKNDGVLIKGGATQNTLSGNYVGTTASGNAKLGNTEDGVAIVHADGNSLSGCSFADQPFVYYNVLSGNGGNGLRINDSNDTTVQANFMGAGANNATVVANHQNGLLVSGNSSETQVGGVIPLGNVISGNKQNGIDVADTASGFTSFNTFGGTFAFAGAAPNRKDGILVTSTGGNNLIRTSIIGGNRGNGIEIGDHATGVQVTETAVGTNSSIQTAIPNKGDGILIDGHAHNNAIGGFQPSIEPQVTVSGNDKYGIAIADSAHDNNIFHTVIGTNAQGTAPLANGKGGISIGSGTSYTTIGGSASPLQTSIQANDGPGVLIQSSKGNTLVGNAISGNTGDGVRLVKARKTTIGGTNTGSGSQLAAGQGNRIVVNQGYGLYARGACNGSVVQDNTIAANAQGNVNITNAHGITYIPKSAS